VAHDALREQKRVTRRGGRVVASIGDFGSTMIYPLSPAIEKLIAAYARLKEDPADPCFVNFNGGREALELFSLAGLVDVQMQPYFAPSEQSFYSAGEHDVQPGLGAFASMAKRDGWGGTCLARLAERGLITDQDIDQAQQEIEAWNRHPHAVCMSATVLAAGTVP
jgi:hypothetical protein